MQKKFTESQFECGSAREQVIAAAKLLAESRAACQKSHEQGLETERRLEKSILDAKTEFANEKRRLEAHSAGQQKEFEDQRRGFERWSENILDQMRKLEIDSVATQKR